MTEKAFTKAEIAHTLGIQLYMLTAWEKQFDIVPLRENDEAVYTPQQLATFRSIKELLYEKGLTMAAAKKALQDTSGQFEGKELHAASPLFFEPTKVTRLTEHAQKEPSFDQRKSKDIAAKLLQIKAQLIKINTSL